MDRRQERQEQRIDQGIQSGALTPREANRLEKGQQHVENLETKAQADGKITAKEKLRLEHAQDRAEQAHLPPEARQADPVTAGVATGSTPVAPSRSACQPLTDPVTLSAISPPAGP